MQAAQPLLVSGILPLTPDKELAQRRAVISEALSWVRTPYRQHADRKGAGVDCAMLLVRCWVDGGVLQPFDPRPYPPEWHMHNSEERYLEWMDALASRVDTPKPGDVVIYRFGRCFSHGAVVVAPGRIVHAFGRLGQCVETGIDDDILAGRRSLYFDLWKKHR